MKKEYREVYTAYTGDVFLTKAECEHFEKHSGVLRCFLVKCNKLGSGIEKNICIVTQPSITGMEIEYIISCTFQNKYIMVNNELVTKYTIDELQFKDLPTLDVDILFFIYDDLDETEKENLKLFLSMIYHGSIKDLPYKENLNLKEYFS